MKKILSFFCCSLTALICGEWEWYRRLHGGKWAYCYIGDPIFQMTWLKVAENTTADSFYMPLASTWGPDPVIKDYSAIEEGDEPGETLEVDDGCEGCGNPIFATEPRFLWGDGVKTCTTCGGAGDDHEPYTP